MAHNTRSKGFVVSVDFGLMRDHTAIVIGEETDEFNLVADGFSDPRRENLLTYVDIGMIRRLPLQTSYPDVTRIVGNIIKELPGRPRRPVLLCDATGVGRGPISFMAKAGLRPIALTYTSGMSVTEVSSTEWHVPKKDIVTATMVALQDCRLRIAPDLEHAALLREELMNFKLKIRDSGHEAFEAGRESIHDDICFATFQICWWIERSKPKPAHYATSSHMER
jgi:hypothetical protein